MIDQATLNEDWPKVNHWDLHRGGAVITTLNDLLWALGVEDESPIDQRIAVKQFMQLPAWLPAPLGLKLEAIKFVGGTPTS